MNIAVFEKSGLRPRRQLYFYAILFSIFMPTILTIGPYRFFFGSLDYGEPAHVHVQREKMVAKFWLDPVTLEKAGGFRPHELNEIGGMVKEHREFLLERWNEYFGN